MRRPRVRLTVGRLMAARAFILAGWRWWLVFDQATSQFSWPAIPGRSRQVLHCSPPPCKRAAHPLGWGHGSDMLGARWWRGHRTQPRSCLVIGSYLVADLSDTGAVQAMSD